MSVHLVGGGATTVSDAALYAPFVAEAALRARAANRERPRIAVISLHPEAEEKAAALAELLAAAAGDVRIDAQLTAGRPAGSGELLPYGGRCDLDGRVGGCRQAAAEPQ